MYVEEALPVQHPSIFIMTMYSIGLLTWIKSSSRIKSSSVAKTNFHSHVEHLHLHFVEMSSLPYHDHHITSRVYTNMWVILVMMWHTFCRVIYLYICHIISCDIGTVLLLVAKRQGNDRHGFICQDHPSSLSAQYLQYRCVIPLNTHIIWIARFRPIYL